MNTKLCIIESIKSSSLPMMIMCDWIWENPASTHNYKYLEKTKFNYLKYYNSGREADACMKFATIL